MVHVCVYVCVSLCTHTHAYTHTHTHTHIMYNISFFEHAIMALILFVRVRTCVREMLEYGTEGH